VADNKTNNADERKMRLQALRNAHKQGADSKPNARPSGTRPGGAGEDNRKREFVKKLLQNRMQQGAGGDESIQGNTGRNNQLRRKAFMNHNGKASNPAGKGLDNFPRLKAMLEQRGNQAKMTDSVPVQELEERVSRIESVLEETRKKIEDTKSGQDNKLQVVSNESGEEGKG
jgi:hypothetical protein